MHCHILPGIDDGAKTTEDAIELLKAEKNQGVSKIVFTPHFHPERLSLLNFLSRREKSFNTLKNTDYFTESGFETRLGAEVYYSVKILEMDISKLCFEGTNYLLLELPVENRPYGLTNTVKSLIERGYTPVLAHVERYGYFTNAPSSLYDLVTIGCVAQVNASSVIHGSRIRGVSALQYIKWELAHIISSDAHSIKTRSPNTKAAYDLVKKKLGEEYLDWLCRNAENIYEDRFFDVPLAHKPKKFLGKWK